MDIKLTFLNEKKYLIETVKRQTSGASSDNEWQRMTASDNEWYNEWQQVTASDNEWQRVVQRVAILANLLFFSNKRGAYL